MQLLCRVLGVSRSGFYAWQSRPLSAHALEDEALKREIGACHVGFRRAYGARRVHAQLRDAGSICSRRRVSRLMRELGIKPSTDKLYQWRPSHPAFYSAAGNHLEGADAPSNINQVWVGDFTHIRTAEGWLMYAVVMDLYSRKVVGWSFASKRNATFTVSALRMAVNQAKPPTGCLFHSDQGIEYAAYEYQDALADAGLKRSMSRKSTPLDNAAMESYFHTLKSEVVHHRSYASRSEAASEIIAYMSFYNAERLHSTLGYLSPEKYEMLNL